MAVAVGKIRIASCSDFVNFAYLMLEIKRNTFTVVFTSD